MDRSISAGSGNRSGAVNWLEASLVVDGEIAEAVAEVLSRYVGTAVTMEQTVHQDDKDDMPVPDALITVRAYFPEDNRSTQTRQEIESGLGYLRMIHELPAPAYRTLADQNWMDSWRKHYRPIHVGRRLLVLPAWMETPGSDRVAVKIEPGMAFGTGTHPSTQLCLRLIEQLIPPDPGAGTEAYRQTPTTFIDVGCGSGILSIAALRLGVSQALGVDIDADAIRSARHNARLNGIGSELQLEVASLTEIREGRFRLAAAPLVAVNILAPVILEMLREGIADLVLPGGSMLIAGILESQASEIGDAALRAGLVTAQRVQSGEWVALRTLPLSDNRQA